MDQDDRETRRAARRAAHDEAKARRRDNFEQLTDTVRFHADDAAAYAKPAARGLWGAVVEVGRWIVVLVILLAGIGIAASVISWLLTTFG